MGEFRYSCQKVSRLRMGLFYSETTQESPVWLEQWTNGNKINNSSGVTSCSHQDSLGLLFLKKKKSVSGFRIQNKHGGFTSQGCWIENKQKTRMQQKEPRNPNTEERPKMETKSWDSIFTVYRKQSRHNCWRTVWDIRELESTSWHRYDEKAACCWGHGICSLCQPKWLLQSRCRSREFRKSLLNGSNQQNQILKNDKKLPKTLT